LEHLVSDLSQHIDSAEQVSAVRTELLRVARDEPGRWWSAQELRDTVQNGYPSTLVSIALNDLIASDDLRLNNRLHVQYSG
jgi:hypothetical protein